MLLCEVSINAGAHPKQLPAGPGLDFSRVYGNQKCVLDLKGAKDALVAGASPRDAHGKGRRRPRRSIFAGGPLGLKAVLVP
jgi:hypothetical protein